MTATLRTRLILLLTFGLFVMVVEWLAGWQAVWHAWQRLTLWQQLLAFILLVLTYIARAWRNYDYFSAKMKHRWWACMRLTIYHNALNNLLPLRSGELSFPLLMRREFGVGYSRSLPALLLMRLLDLVVLGVMALLWAHPPQDVAHAMLLLILAVAPLSGYPLQRLLLQTLLPYRRHAIARRLTQIVAGLPRTFSAYLRCYLISWANWGIKLGMLAWLLAAMAGTPLQPAFFGALGGELTSILPVNPPAGLGTYEAGIVGAMALFGVPASQVATAAVNIHLVILISSLIAAMLAVLLQGMTRKA